MQIIALTGIIFMISIFIGKQLIELERDLTANISSEFSPFLTQSHSPYPTIEKISKSYAEQYKSQK